MSTTKENKGRATSEYHPRYYVAYPVETIIAPEQQLDICQVRTYFESTRASLVYWVMSLP